MLTGKKQGNDAMKFYEYGNKNNPAVLYIHGMGCDVLKSFQVPTEVLQKDYRIIAAALDGYDGEASAFSSIHEQAEKIATFLNKNYHGSVYAVIGMSMGGFIALDLLCRYGITAEKLLLDSGYTDNLPFAKLIASAVSWGFDCLLHDKHRRLVKSGMKMMMGYCFDKKDLHDNPSRQTIYNSEYACMTYTLPDNLGALQNCRVTYLYGEKEKQMIKGMHTLKAYLPDLEEISWGNVGHGEIMAEKPKLYAEMLKKLLIN